MKVYVDENDGGKTITFKEENGKRQYLYVHDKEGFIFKSLADHDKQVRKEVVQEIINKIVYYAVSILDEAGNVKENVWGISKKDVDKILDQIQGETK